MKNIIKEIERETLRAKDLVTVEWLNDGTRKVDLRYNCYVKINGLSFNCKVFKVCYEWEQLTIISENKGIIGFNLSEVTSFEILEY